MAIDSTLAKFREILGGTADQIMFFEDMMRSPRNSETIKNSAARSANDSFIDYTRLIIHVIEVLDRRLTALEAKGRP